MHVKQITRDKLRTSRLVKYISYKWDGREGKVMGRRCVVSAKIAVLQ